MVTFTKNAVEEGMKKIQVKLAWWNTHNVKIMDAMMVVWTSLTIFYCFKEVDLPQVHQEETEVVMARLIAFADGDVPVEVKATPATTEY